MKHGNQLINLKGLIFGHLLVKRVDEIKSSKVSGKHMANAYWLCLCDLCGCLESVRSSYLRAGTIRMCGSCARQARLRYFRYLENLRKEVYRKMSPQELNDHIVDMKEKNLTAGKDGEAVYNHKEKKLRIKKAEPNSPLFREKLLIPIMSGKEACLNQARALRDSGTSIKDIAELLDVTIGEVREALQRKS